MHYTVNVTLLLVLKKNLTTETTHMLTSSVHISKL